MIALLLKELDGVRAYMYAVLASLVFVAFDHLLPEAAAWVRPEILSHGVVDWVFLSGLLAFSLGHTLVAVEYTEGHIEFLDGLPVRRWQVFLSKVLAVCVPMTLLVVGTVAIKALTLWGLGTPFSEAAVEALFVYGLRLSLVLVAFSSLGLAASWMGGLGWGVLFVMLFGLLILSVAAPSTRPYVIVESMHDIDWNGSRPVHQWGPVIVWGLISAFSVTLSGLLFLGPGRWLVKQGSWSGAFVKFGGLGCGGLLFVLVLALASLDLVFVKASELMSPTDRVSTEHFRFLYNTRDSAEAQALIAEADAISDTLAEQMGNDKPMYLEIELLGAGRAHAGRFLGGKIRMALGEDARDTLIHELAHAHAFAISSWAVEHQFDHVRFFEEGLASYYEGKNSTSDKDYRWAAGVWATDQARFDLLVEDGLRGETHDSDQAYALGEQFVLALDQEYGSGAVACVLRALGDVGDADISGLSLWVETFGRCDYDLDRVVARYDSNLEEEARSLPSPLPEIAGRMDRLGDRFLLTDRNDTGLELLCRYRDAVDTERFQWEVRNAGIGGVCGIPGTMSGSSFQVQFGFKLDSEAWPIFYPWTTTEL